jgi:hypothetical protein
VLTVHNNEDGELDDPRQPFCVPIKQANNALRFTWATAKTNRDRTQGEPETTHVEGGCNYDAHAEDEKRPNYALASKGEHKGRTFKGWLNVLLLKGYTRAYIYAHT